MRCAAGRFACGGYGIFVPAKAVQNTSATMRIPPHNQRIAAKDMTVFYGTLQGLVDLSQSDAQAFDFCRRYTIYNMAYGRLSHFWTSSILSVCHSEPAVLQAMLALTAIHHEHSFGSRSPTLERSADAHYNMAVGYIQRTCNTSLEQYQVILIVCLLLLTCDVLQNRYGTALLHLNNGRQIFQSMRAKRGALRHPCVLQIHPDTSSIEDELTYMMALVDLQSTNYGSLRPMFKLVTDSDGKTNQGDNMPLAFASLDDAWRYMMIIYNEVEHLVPTSADCGPTQYLCYDPASVIQQGRLLGHLSDWRHAYRNSAYRVPSSSRDPKDSWLNFSTLHLQMLQLLAEISIATCLNYGDEMQYDIYLPQFSNIVSIAENIGPMLPRVTFNVGVVQPLFLLCSFCRDPAIRRRALAVLSRAGKESYWDSRLVALCSREKMLFEEAAASYLHDPEEPLPEERDLATLIPRSARYTETWAFYRDNDMRELDVMFKRRKLRHGQLQYGEEEWEMFSKRIPAPAA